MSDKLAVQQPAPLALATFTTEQRALIKRTVAPTATDDELAMFLHIAGVSGLDPLRKQIHFIKVSGRVYTVADVNGLQARAAREPDFEGLLHAVVFENDEFAVDNTTGQVVKHTTNPLKGGKILGAWATVHRKGKLPFTSVVRLTEYVNTANGLWATKPAVMIDKVAKSTALRLAYPEQLGGIYEAAELDQAEKDVTPTGGPVVSRTEEVKGAIKTQLAARQSRLVIVDAPNPTPPQPAPPAKLTPKELMARMVEVGKSFGKEGDALKSSIKGATGKTKPSQLTEDDIGKLVDALSAIASVHTVKEPPPEVTLPGPASAPAEDDIPF